MRSLATLGLIILSVLPLAAHDHGAWGHRGRRRIVVVEPRPFVWVERDRWSDHDRCDDARWERRPEYWRRRADCDDDDLVVVRPRPRVLTPPWQARVVLRFGR